MVTKRNVFENQLPLIIIAATVVLLTIIWLVYRTFNHSRCDSIFEQTADRVQANLDFIKVKGELALGTEKAQELTAASQNVAFHLKSCCVLQQAGALNAEQLQVCISGAKDYQTQITQVATNIKEATAAEEQRNPDLAKQKTESAKEAAIKVANTDKTLGEIFTALTIKLGQTVEANIMDPADVHFYRLPEVNEKTLTVRLENQSRTWQPSIRVLKRDNSYLRDWSTADAPGADLVFSFSTEPGEVYYFEVGSKYRMTAGGYKLTVR